MKKCLTIGVAGHVDHGKTALVRILTGIDTDRLREEKERGLSIESGIAPLLLEEDLEIAFVDVPGHKDYLKNTIRGLSSVDMALLVVAANDGVMPQTLEHIRILELFGVPKGLIVISKTDLVDEETLELAEIELREACKGTFLEDTQILRYSSVTREGERDLKEAIISMARNLRPKDPNKPFRMWIDQLRVFSGFGTVVSGTVQQGTITEGAYVEILPIKERTKVRSLESHHRKIKEALPGQRIGVNLIKVQPSEVARGMELVAPDSIGCFHLMNVKLHNFGSSELILRNRQKVKLYLGTGCHISEVLLLEKEELYPGEEGFAQIRLNGGIGVLPGDRFIVTPMNIPKLLGGGVVLETAKMRLKTSNRQNIRETLYHLDRSDYQSFVLNLLNWHGTVSKEELRGSFLLDAERLNSTIQEMVLAGWVVEISPDKIITRGFKEELKEKIIEIVNSTLTENPIQVCVKKQEISHRLEEYYGKRFRLIGDEALESLLEELLEEGRLGKEEGGFVIAFSESSLPPDLSYLTEIILDFSRKAHINPFSADTIWKTHSRRIDKNHIKKVLNYLRAKKLLVRVNDGRFLNQEALEEIKGRIRAIVEEKGIFTIHDCKDAFGYGRTVAVPILEYLDRIGFTLRTEEGRIIKQ